MAQHGKKYREALAQVDREALYSVAEAVDIVQKLARPSFDETVELAVRLGVDPRKADQIVRAPCRCRRGPAVPNGCCLRRRRAGGRGPCRRRRRRGRR